MSSTRGEGRTRDRGFMNPVLYQLSYPGEVEICVAGPGVEPGLRDYEPRVQPYTTPHVY